MLSLLKFFLWTACAVGAGVFLAKGDIDGRTPVEHLERVWKHNVNPSKVDRLKEGLKDALDEARGRIAEQPKPERYSEDEREAVNRLIAKSPTK
jgi:hypothetical protein